MFADLATVGAFPAAASGAFGITDESAKFLFRVGSVVSPTAYRREASFLATRLISSLADGDSPPVKN